MASFRYLRNISAEDTAPDAPKVYTRAQRWENWWDYNLKWVVLGTITAAVVIYVLLDAFVFTTKPDQQLAIISDVTLFDNTIDPVRDAFSSFATDLNGDGKASIQVYSYFVPFDEETLADTAKAYEIMAGQTQLSGDIAICNTNIFILSDPKHFQESTLLLCNLDGTYPAEPEYANWEKMVYLLSDCPAIPDLPEELDGYYIARRGGTSKDALALFEKDDALWNALTEGATPYTESSDYAVS